MLGWLATGLATGGVAGGACWATGKVKLLIERLIHYFFAATLASGTRKPRSPGEPAAPRPNFLAFGGL